jgi:1,4-dihydroxy-2-naphthoate octaprenyltransferase
LFARRGIGEVMAFLGLGPAPTIGTYYAITRTLGWSPFLLGIVAGAMGSAVLYVNEFPDLEADKAKGRLNLVVRMGKKKASRYLKVFFVLAYAGILLMILLRAAPFSLVLAFLTIPWAAKASAVLEEKYQKVEDHLPSNALTIKTAVSTGYLLAAGYAIAVLLAL